MPADDADLLDFLQEPAFVLEPGGRILKANRSAKRLIGSDPQGRNLTEISGSAPEVVQSYISRCSGTTSQLIGSLLIASADGAFPKFRVLGARLPDRGESVRIAIRCLPDATDGFSILARKIKELNSEIGSRRATQARLEESIRSNEVLLRELHHRVKNNIQLMIGLISAAEREAHSDEARRYLVAAVSRLVAIGAAQQIIYEAQEIETVSAPEFLEKLCRAVSASFGKQMEIQTTASPTHLDSNYAFPLALITNELLTNSFKHRTGGTSSNVRVSLQNGAGEWLLTVHDDGPGISESTPQRRSSGLGLVRGLARQIGGSVHIENAGGTRISVRFRNSGIH